MYVNFSEDQNFDTELEKLLRDIHQSPSSIKPPIGKNPFAKQSSGADIPIAIVKESSIPDITKSNTDVIAIYKTALETARQGDLIAWRKIIQQAKHLIPGQLAAWRASHEANPPSSKADLSRITTFQRI